jgi:hypothetical protein
MVLNSFNGSDIDGSGVGPMASTLRRGSVVLVGLVVASALAAGPALAAMASPACVTPPPSDPRMTHSSPQHLVDSLTHAPGETPAEGGGGMPGVQLPAAAPADPVGAATTALGTYVQQQHLDRGVGAQLQDALNLDSYALAHQKLVRAMLEPEVGPDSQLGMSPGTGVLMYHLDNGHWNASPGDQVRAITDDFPDWYAMHRMMVEGTAQSLASGSNDAHGGGGHGGH